MKRGKITSSVLGISVLFGLVAFAPHADAANPRQDGKLCALAESGFTYFPTENKVSFGVVVKNRTKKNAVRVDALANFYDAGGKLVHTSKDSGGLDYILPSETVYGGGTESVTTPISTMKVSIVCAPQSASGIKNQEQPLLRHLTLTGSVTKSDADSATASGTIRNVSKRGIFGGTPVLVFRDSTGKVIGGDGMNTGEFRVLAPGLEMAWESYIDVPIPLGSKAQGTVGSIGLGEGIYN